MAPPAGRGPNDRQARPKLEPCPASRDCCDRSRGTGVPSARAARGATRRHSARARSAQAARGARPAAAPRESRRPHCKLDRRALGRLAARDGACRAPGLRGRSAEGAGGRAGHVEHEGARLQADARAWSARPRPLRAAPERGPGVRRPRAAICAAARGARALARCAAERVRRRAVRRDRSRAAGGATAGSPRGANRCRPRARPPRRGRARPRRAGARAALPRALPRTADGRALSGPAGRRTPWRPIATHVGPSHRASASSPGPSSRGSSAPCSSRTRRSTLLGSSLPRRHPRRTAAGGVGHIASSWPASSRRP